MVRQTHDLLRAAPLVDAKLMIGSTDKGSRPTIYCFINSQHPAGMYQVVAMSQGGSILAEDYGRTEHECRIKIGLGGFRHHNQYELAHPSGYMLVWIDNPKNDPELRRVIEINQRLDEIEEAL
jgi:hypothetical protein